MPGDLLPLPLKRPPGRRVHRAHRPVYTRPWFVALIAGSIGAVVAHAATGPNVPPAPLDGAPNTFSASARTTIPGSGTVEVGSADFPPGLYRSSGNRVDTCQWQRTTDTFPAPSHFVASAHPQGEDYVVLRTGETFLTRHCNPWRRVGPEPDVEAS